MSLGQLLVYPLRGQGGVLWVLCAVGLFVLLALFEWTRLGEGQHLLAMVLLPIPWLITFAILQHYAWASLSHVAARCMRQRATYCIAGAPTSSVNRAANAERDIATSAASDPRVHARAGFR